MVHPVVRQDEDEVDKLVTEFNRQLRPDGWQFKPANYISGKPIYAGSRIAASPPATALGLPKRTLLDDHSALMDHLGAIERDLASDPAGAIASAKELVESMYKLILDKRGIELRQRGPSQAVQEGGRRARPGEGVGARQRQGQRGCPQGPNLAEHRRVRPR